MLKTNYKMTGVGLQALNLKMKHNRHCGHISFLDGRRFDIIYFSVQLFKAYCDEYFIFCCCCHKIQF